MANTVIQLKKSSTPSAAPTDLAEGEIALNYADGRIYYKDSSNTIKHISAGNNYSTVNVGGTFLTASIENAILGVKPGQNIELTPDFVHDAFTITANLKLAFDVANAAYNAANAIGGGVDVTGIYNEANAAYAGANQAGIYANGAYAGANQAGIIANAAFGVSNTALQNTNGVVFNGSLTIANTLTSGNINVSGATTYLNANSITISSNLTAGNVVAGNIIVTGATSFLNANSIVVSGNVTASYFFGNGSALTGIVTDFSPAYNTANAAFAHSNTTYTAVNSAFAVINTAFGVANTALQNTNGVVFNGSLTVANTLTSGNIIVSGATTYLNANNITIGKTELNTFSYITTTTGVEIADTFNASVYRAMNYQITMNVGSSYEITQILVIQDGSSSYLTEYGALVTNGILGTFTTDYNAGNVTLNVASTVSGTTLNIFRTGSLI